jgi:hypothetical protein
MELAQKAHGRAVRYFWILLISATLVSLIGNVAHAILPFIPHVVVQIGAASVPPIVLLAAVHGIALAVRAGASGRVYHCAVGAVAVIGVGAFALSFLALRDLMQTIGYSPQTAWIFPAIIDTAVAVSTIMLVALGDKPVRRAHTSSTVASAKTPAMQPPPQSANPKIKPLALANKAQASRSQTSAPTRPDTAQAVQNNTQPESAQHDADLASDLIQSGVTTQPIETVIAVLAARRDGLTINAAAKAVGINYRTAQRIFGAFGDRKDELVSAS